jgi:hypothetical protein
MSCTHTHIYLYVYTQIFIAINLDTSPSSLLSSSSSSFVYFQIIPIIRVSFSLLVHSLLYDVVSQEGVSNLISFRIVAWSTECNYRTYRACVTFTHVQSYRKKKTTTTKENPYVYMYIWHKAHQITINRWKKKWRRRSIHMFKVERDHNCGTNG